MIQYNIKEKFLYSFHDHWGKKPKTSISPYFYTNRQDGLYYLLGGHTRVEHNAINKCKQTDII
jgi:hypothetical protein